jgi:nucleoside-diphosphate-sugar epimerase
MKVAIRSRRGGDDMLVLITGASGYVGSHTVRAVTADGHRVRALVRRPEKLRSALEPLGVDPDDVDVVVGDATDPTSVQAAVDGVDAVVHTAAVYETSARFHDIIRRTNVAAARLVLAAALDAGADPVVHVSSIVAVLSGQPGSPITPDSEPVSSPVPSAYVTSRPTAIGSHAPTRNGRPGGDHPPQRRVRPA